MKHSGELISANKLFETVLREALDADPKYRALEEAYDRMIAATVAGDDSAYELAKRDFDERVAL